MINKMSDFHSNQDYNLKPSVFDIKLWVILSHVGRLPVDESWTIIIGWLCTQSGSSLADPGPPEKD